MATIVNLHGEGGGWGEERQLKRVEGCDDKKRPISVVAVPRQKHNIMTTVNTTTKISLTCQCTPP